MIKTYLYNKGENRLFGIFPTHQEALNYAKHVSQRQYHAKGNRIKYNKFTFLTDENIFETVTEIEINCCNLLSLLNNFPILLIRINKPDVIVKLQTIKNQIVELLSIINSIYLYKLVLPYLSIEGKKALEYCTGLWENQDYLSNETIELIFNAVSKVYNINILSFKNSTKREHEVVKPRFCTMWFLRNYSAMSLKAIGSQFKSKSITGLDHSTVSNGLKTYQDLVDTDRYTQTLHKRVKDIIEQELLKIDVRTLLS